MILINPMCIRQQQQPSRLELKYEMIFINPAAPLDPIDSLLIKVSECQLETIVLLIQLDSILDEFGEEHSKSEN